METENNNSNKQALAPITSQALCEGQTTENNFYDAYIKRVLEKNETTTEPEAENPTTALTIIKNVSELLPAKVSKQYAAVTTVEQCVQLATSQKTDTIGGLIRSYGTENIKVHLALHLVNLNMVSGVKRPLNEIQIEFITDELLTSYRLLTMADVFLIFRRAAKGYYGELYENLTPPKVLKWFADYFDERCETAQKLNDQTTEKLTKSYAGANDRDPEARKLDAILKKKGIYSDFYRY